MSPFDLQHGYADGLVCRDCGNDNAITSDSERGSGFFCPDCSGIKCRNRIINLYDACSCCGFDFDTPTSTQRKCDECRERCGSFDPYCSVEYERKEVDSPVDCEDHHFEALPNFEPDEPTVYMCSWCGMRTNRLYANDQMGENWNEQREAALERDNKTCQLCGDAQSNIREESGRGLHVHHIKPRRLHKCAEEANELTNLVSVCGSCHRRLEWKPQSEQKELLSEAGWSPE